MWQDLVIARSGAAGREGVAHGAVRGLRSGAVEDFVNAEAYRVAELTDVFEFCAHSSEFYEPLLVLLFEVLIAAK